MDIGYNGIWGYHPLLVSLANTGEPLFITNRSGNRPSHEGAIPVFNLAVQLCRDAGFTDVLLRGDRDFALTSGFDAWTADSVRFVFGIDARKNLIGIADNQEESMYDELRRRADTERLTGPRRRPVNVKDQVVKEREFEEFRYFFYITNDLTMTPDQVVNEARQRCNQENLHDQLKNGVRAFHAPVNTLCANWTYMVMGSLAWTLKAWLTMLLPSSPRWRKRHDEEREQLLRMEFRAFVAYFIAIPCQVVLTGRRILLRVLAWNRWLATFFRMVDAT